MNYILLICFLILTICIVVLTIYAVKYYITFNSFIFDSDTLNPFILIYLNDDDKSPIYVHKSNVISVYLNDKLNPSNTYDIVINCANNKVFVETYENIENAQKRLSDLLFELSYE